MARVTRDHQRSTPPTICWRGRRGDLSSGDQEGNQVAIRAGRSLLDQRRVLLHELAHWLTDRGHTELFWSTGVDGRLDRPLRVQVRGPDPNPHLA
ncbi:MAG: hypothetical protein ABSE84_00870 [Isosphaeraceae bacterium]